MEHIGIDVHKRESQVCVLGEGGEVVLEQRIATRRDKLAELLGSTAPGTGAAHGLAGPSRLLLRLPYFRGHAVTQS